MKKLPCTTRTNAMRASQITKQTTHYIAIGSSTVLFVPHVNFVHFHISLSHRPRCVLAGIPVGGCCLFGCHFPFAIHAMYVCMLYMCWNSCIVFLVAWTHSFCVCYQMKVTIDMRGENMLLLCLSMCLCVIEMGKEVCSCIIHTKWVGVL